jgi:hypothetical protein
MMEKSGQRTMMGKSMVFCDSDPENVVFASIRDGACIHETSLAYLTSLVDFGALIVYLLMSLSRHVAEVLRVEYVGGGLGRETMMRVCTASGYICGAISRFLFGTSG